MSKVKGRLELYTYYDDSISLSIFPFKKLIWQESSLTNVFYIEE